jgi:signal transduction histidine kinase
MPDRFGLRGMRERVEGLGGVLQLQGDEKGTIIEVYLPIISTDEHAPVLGSREPAGNQR